MASKIEEADVRHISLLARLDPGDEEIRLFAGQLSAILQYMDQLNEVNTADVPPTAHALPVRNVFRPDQAGESLQPDQALQNAPQRDGNFFAVPKVLDSDSGA